jgi:hypothetical protein
MKEGAAKRGPVHVSRRVSASMMIRRAVLGGALTALAAAPVLGQAGWTVTNLHPAGVAGAEGVTASVANGVSVDEAGGVQVVGGVVFDQVSHASLWSGAGGATAQSWVDLNPDPAVQSVANGVDGGVQVGAIAGFGLQAATMWTGTAASFVNLNPPLATSSTLNAISGNQQVGEAAASSLHSARIWEGTAATIDLGGYSALGTDGVQQVGYWLTGSFPFTGTAALLWTGSAASLVELEPADAYTSAAYDVDAGQQVGWVKFGGLIDPEHATLWSGSAASVVDLHPAGADHSEARGVSHGVQVGEAAVYTPEDPFNAVSHASAWWGTAASWVDLHEFLPAGMFSRSGATGVWSDGATTYVVGFGVTTETGQNQALLWTLAPEPACPADLDEDEDVDVFDLLAYLDLWFAADAGAELTGDSPTMVDVFDLLAYLDGWFAGC